MMVELLLLSLWYLVFIFSRSSLFFLEHIKRSSIIHTRPILFVVISTNYRENRHIKKKKNFLCLCWVGCYSICRSPTPGGRRVSTKVIVVPAATGSLAAPVHLCVQNGS
jgi:hypothetical protein